MFAVDTKIFYSNKDINTVFLKINDELQKINECLISDKLSFNMKKKKKNTRFFTNLAKKIIFH